MAVLTKREWVRILKATAVAHLKVLKEIAKPFIYRGTGKSLARPGGNKLGGISGTRAV